MGTHAENKKAYFDYEILETFRAGLVLSGHEVKAIRRGLIQLTGSYVVFQHGELYLVGATIPPYQPQNTPSQYDPKRSRKLLVRRQELSYLFGKSQERGLTLIPLEVYSVKGLLKLDFALAKGKKQHDKRDKIRKKEAQREIERALKAG